MVRTWRHFNLHGEFDFSDEKMIDSVGLTIPKNPAPRKSYDEWPKKRHLKTRCIQRSDVREDQSIGRRKKTVDFSILWNFYAVCLKTPILSEFAFCFPQRFSH
jgi:hypothetical protein